MKRARRAAILAVCVIIAAGLSTAVAAQTLRPLSAADQALGRYFEAQAAELADRCLTTNTVAKWSSTRDRLRRELQEMLGLLPMPARGDLKPVITGQIERDSFIVEKLHFQSSPGLYVTANLYRPRQQQRPLPTILYLSGHGPVIKNGISYGNKVSYQHH